MLWFAKLVIESVCMLKWIVSSSGVMFSFSDLTGAIPRFPVESVQERSQNYYVASFGVAFQLPEHAII